MSNGWKQVTVPSIEDNEARVLTVFNEDEVLFVELLEDECSAIAAVNWYASLGFGVSMEVV